MELSEISIYFTEKTLDEIVQKVGGIKHVSWSYGSGFKKGDSYLSNVFRLIINYVKNDESPMTVTAVVKGMPKHSARRRLFRSGDFFRNEINFYTAVLPAFEQFQKNRNCTNPFIEFPKFYAAYSDGENDFIALEDVTALGYGGSSRQKGIDIEHCQLIMKTLGKFHAVSLAFKDIDPEGFEKVVNSIEETYYEEKYRKWYAPFLIDACNVANDCVSREFPNTHYEEKTKKFLSENLYDDMIKLTFTKTKLAVIGHGDCWQPNFLIKYNGTSPEDIIIIDFQLARYASPVLDIMFFIYSCTHEDLRSQYFDQLINIYHESGSELIKQLGADPKKIFSYSSLQEELQNFGRFGCGMGIESLPLSMKEDDEVFDLDEIRDENAVLTDVWKIGPLEKKEERLRIATIFKHSIDLGYIK